MANRRQRRRAAKARPRGAAKRPGGPPGWVIAIVLVVLAVAVAVARAM